MSGKLFGQEITVIDKVTQQRIPGAKVYSINPKVQRVANMDGRFQLSDFYHCDSVYVSYTNYHTEGYSVQDLRSEVQVELTDAHLPISEMVVTGNRWEKDKSKIPKRINKLNLKDLELLGPQTSADLLESSGYVFVQKSQLAGGSPQLRGFGTNRVMIVVDGVRMNNAIFRSGNLQNVISLDANSLESVEVMFGPGAVMYGSDAIGGVMDFNTKKAKFSTDSSKVLIKANVFGRYSSAANEITTHFDFNYGNEKWAFVTAASYSQFGDLRTGSNGDEFFLRSTYQLETENGHEMIMNDDPQLQISSGFGQWSALQKIAFNPSEKNEFVYGFNYSETTDAPRYDRLIQDKDENDTLDYIDWHYGPQKWMMHRLTWLNSNESVISDHFRITLAYQNYQESRHDTKFGSAWTRNQYERVNIGSLNADFEKKLGERSEMEYGLEYVYNQVNSNAINEYFWGDYIGINPRYPDGSTWQSAGAYLNLENEFADKFSFHSGLRYSHYLINAEFDTTLFQYPVSSTTNNNGSLSGSLGLVYNPSKKGQYYLNVSTGYRAPNIDDIGKVFDSEPGRVVVPNVELKPEHAINGEIGFMQAFKNRFKLDAAVYYTYLIDALARADYSFNGQDSIMYEGTLSRVQAVQNLSEAYVYGAQGGFELVLYKGLTLNSSISYQKGFQLEIDSNVYYPLNHVAPLFGRTSIKYKRRQLFLEFYTVYHGAMDADDMPLGERDDLVYAKDEDGNNYTPSWYTINFKGSIFFNKHLALNFGIENITDQLYRTFGSGISAPGRNYMISLRATF
jgi:hemoglobin/transferrin/lactoferrin receptor protein